MNKLLKYRDIKNYCVDRYGGTRRVPEIPFNRRSASKSLASSDDTPRHFERILAPLTEYGALVSREWLRESAAFDFYSENPYAILSSLEPTDLSKHFS